MDLRASTGSLDPSSDADSIFVGRRLHSLITSGMLEVLNLVHHPITNAYLYAATAKEIPGITRTKESCKLQVQTHVVFDVVGS
jgi:hypothetical protein